MQSLKKSLIFEFKRRVFDESYERIFRCLEELDENEIWIKPNEQLSSVGNLILHLAGNARQWICCGLGGEVDKRKRQDEFSVSRTHTKSQLKELLEVLKQDIESVLEKISEEDLLRKRKVQVFEENGIAILIHVIEHFSYHTGQITWFTKLKKNLDLKYYGEIKLD